MYSLMLKNIPYHIKGGLKRIPIMPAHSRIHLYRNLESTPPPRDMNNIQTALQENIGNTGSKIILRKYLLKLGFTYKENQTHWKLLIEATSSSAESNIYGRFVISQ